MKQAGTDMRKFLSRAAWMAAGTVLFFGVRPVRADLTANCVITVTPVGLADTQPPNAVTDLSAARVSNVEGRVVLTWTAPADQPGNTTVAQYAVKYATYSALSVGSTTTWWNNAIPATSTPTPSAPGTPETPMLVNGLAGGATYYFAIKSEDASGNWSPLDKGTLSGPQASAYPYFVRPAPVAGLLAITNPDTSFNINWDPVTLNANGTPAGSLGYVVRQSGSFTGTFNVVAASGPAVSGFSFGELSSPTTTQYLQIVARDAIGNESDPAASNILEVTPQGIIGQMAVSADPATPYSRVYVPATLMGEMKTSGGDVLLKIAPDADPAVNHDPRTLATYDVSMVSPVQVVDKNFTFSRPAMNVVLQYRAPPSGAEVGVLWWSGTSWIKVGTAVVDPILNTASFQTAIPGIYQVRTFEAATSLTLDKNSVFPRIFTPNGDGINDVVYFVIENPNHSAVDGKIYDVAGGEVADIRMAGAGAPTSDTMVWDGRDRSGRTVHAGIYIYRISGEGKKMTGTVVVAK